MSWREQIRNVTPTFRGVPFKSTETEGQFGRRNVVHEYPQRDRPYIEDLGQRATQWVINGYVQGDDYLAQRDALLQALSEQGPGQLVHPRWGDRLVSVVGYVSVKESHNEGGKATFSFTVVDAGADNLFPLAAQDTAAAVEQAAERCDLAAETRFSGAFMPTGAAPIELDAIAQASATLGGMLATVRRVTSLGGLSALVGTVNGLIGGVVSLIRTPVEFAQGLRSVFANLVSSVRRPVSAVGELQALFRSSARPSATALAGSTRDRILSNRLAYGDFVRTLALTNQARLVVASITNGIEPRTLNAGGAVGVGAAALQDEAPIATAAQAQALRDQVLAQIDEELELNEPEPQTAAALEQLRAAVARDVAARGELLRERSTFTPVAVLPALAVAHRVYQDASRVDELAARNGVRHPGFVPARALEVLL
jgi:prophage DNA circulation protein